MIRNFENTAGVPKKLFSKFKGPYKVKKVIENDRDLISDIESFQNVQKPYKGVWEAMNMRPAHDAIETQCSDTK